MKFPGLMSRAIVAIAAIVGLYVLSASAARAGECRADTNVKASAVPTANTADGGHLARHIVGMTPPQGFSQADGTMFLTDAAWNSAWAGYVASTKVSDPVKCSKTTTGYKQSVILSKLGITTPMAGQSCTAANKKGVCTASNPIQVVSVSFAFKYNSTLKKWILVTGYPESAAMRAASMRHPSATAD